MPIDPVPPDLAIAAVTMALKRLLQSALNRSPLGGEVRTDRPDRVPDAATPVVNLYLHHGLINPFMRNDDVLPDIDRAAGAATARLTRRRRVPLQLNYLLSFYGDDRTLAPQRLMAGCVAALHDTPVLSAEAIAAGAQATLSRPDPVSAAGFEDVVLTVGGISLDDSFRLWSMIKAPFALSIACEAATAVVYGTSQADDVYLVETLDLQVVPPARPGA